jgi:hypothetical protein
MAFLLGNEEGARFRAQHDKPLCQNFLNWPESDEVFLGVGPANWQVVALL